MIKTTMIKKTFLSSLGKLAIHRHSAEFRNEEMIKISFGGIASGIL